ncbi:DEAD/DEAH box helicase [Promicromonospora iranensis]|uniref:Superfamily II RNA helicase n=1 Tax=Promicromonospora iranensis TaxID=1105144 RepID=A0ABU2CSM5_9MICO|nr:DEAD/DEAH box helicase [Promicromonospora iranensis]MDR7384340.1 superfamily II RNA helicase [Promicromonospora iranensis]
MTAPSSTTSTSATAFSATSEPRPASATPKPAGTLIPYLPAPTGKDPDPDVLFESFSEWASAGGRALYPHQEEALLEVMTGSHVVLATPTGSGKSMVAMGAQFAALAAHRSGRGGRTYYTAPLKALVSEKFFDLVAAFGSKNVGMMTGDSAVNPDAPIICCTAEILANLALRRGDSGTTGDGTADDDEAISQVVMDEFHYYGDPQRGWAWQVPLLELTDTQFILMSATLGDTSRLREDIEERTGRPVAEVAGAERPVPLTFSYVVEPLTDVIQELVQTHRAPVYVVHFTQKDAVDRAQSMLSMNVSSKAEKEAIIAEMGAFRFGTGFGKTLSKFLRHGVGVHHAGMLPKYRRLVERLTQKGLLKVVCGTDTLGVGINVPIRTVLLTSLVKFDGERMRHLSAREFHQIAGRAGRAGYDTVGEVLVMAPEHVIENRKILAKAGDDPKKLKKIVRKKAPSGSVNWTDATFERLRDADPEQLVSQFRVNHAMVLNVLARASARSGGHGPAGAASGIDPVDAMRHLLTANHDTETQQAEHVRQAFRIYRSLRIAGVVEKVRVPDADGRLRPSARLMVDLPRDFALNQPLSPFALAAMDLLDVESATHALDVVSVIEATLDDPRQVLMGQQNRARGEAVAAMKAEGLEYEERMELLEEVTWPKPLADLLEPAFQTYRRTNPWVADAELSPKSVVRDMVEKAMTFAEIVSVYGLERTEGVVLRYLADAFRAVRQVVPDEHRTEEVQEIIEWLGELVRGVDSSLLDEWERLANPVDDDADLVTDGELAEAGAEAPVRPVTGNPRAFRRLVRNAMFRRVELVARESYGALAALGGGWDADAWADALDPLFEEQGDDAVGFGPEARSAALLTILEPGAELPGSAGGDSVRVEPGTWWVRQVLDDADSNRDWAITAQIDLAASDEAGEVVLTVLSVGQI